METLNLALAVAQDNFTLTTTFVLKLLSELPVYKYSLEIKWNDYKAYHPSIDVHLQSEDKNITEEDKEQAILKDSLWEVCGKDAEDDGYNPVASYDLWRALKLTRKEERDR